MHIRFALSLAGICLAGCGGGGNAPPPQSAQPVLETQRLAASEVNAVETAVDLQDPADLAGLQEALGAEDPWVQLSAIDELGGIGTEDAVFALGSMLGDNRADTRESVVLALGDIGTQAALGYLHQALSDPDAGVRETAREVLEELQEEE